MAIDMAELARLVHDQIARLYAQTGMAGLGTPVVAFEPLGIPVPPSSFLLHPTDAAPLPALAVRHVSILANQVPVLNEGTYARTQFQFDEFYQYLINAVEPAAASTGPLFVLLARARQMYEEGSVVDLLNPHDKIYPTDADPADWYLPGTPDSWTTFRFTSEPSPPPFTTYSGAATLRGTFSFDFDRGQESPGGDVFWEQFTAHTRALVPKGAARLADLGAADFDHLGPEQLLVAPFSANPISGSDDATDRLQVKRVFAVKTNGGHYVKVQVLNRFQQPGSFYMLQFRFVGYAPAAAGVAPPNLHTVMLRREGVASVAAPGPKWSWTLAAAAAPAAAAPAAAAPAAAAAVPLARAELVRDLMVTHPAFHFARPVLVEASAPAQTESLQLAFELRAVTLNRPWLSLGILADRNWFIRGYRAGEFGAQMLHALPTTMLVARNVVVTTTNSPDDTATRAVGFGPFSLSGRTASGLPAADGLHSAVLSMPAPQIIGWVAQPLTGIAPLGDPTLGPH